MWPKVLKVAKKFGSSGKSRTFVPMKEPRYIITGRNELTKQWEQLSRPMGKEEAQQRLEREIQNRRNQRYAAHTRLRIERLDAVQLTIQFEAYENM